MVQDQTVPLPGGEAEGFRALSDEALYPLVCDGHEEALETLLSRYQSSLTDFIRGILSDSRDAEETMIDAFAALAASRGRYKGKSSLKTYLFSIGRHLALRRARKTREIPMEDDKLFARLRGNPGPEEEVVDTQELRDALTQLPVDSRQALSLIYLHGMSYKEAGEVMNKNQAQMTHLAANGRKALRRLISAQADT